MIVVSLYGPLVALKTYVVKPSEGCTIDVGDLVIRNKKELLEDGRKASVMRERERERERAREE